MEDRLPRRLAAILYADVAGYSRLTGEDEDGTHRALGEYLDLISATIESLRGQVVHYAGDAVLARFDAVVDAISSAVNIQNQINTRNQEVPDDRKVQFRIGVNLGDVIEDRGDIYGDGVNVAARLESLAEPGGICISESVRTAVGKKLPHDYEFMGEQEVKNIAEPVRAYRVLMGSQQVSQSTSSEKPDLELPDKPSIAVMPFTNMSDDPEQEYFSDGITEDIITELSKFHSLFVISRDSSFSYKDHAVKAQHVSKDLGVQYVLEGSVRRAGDRVRVTAQLIEGSTGKHIWAERYDRELGDIFAVQDEVSRAIIAMTAGRLDAVGAERAKQKPPEDINAYDLVLQGVQQLNRNDRDARQEAIELFKKAVELGPNYARAYTYLAVSYCLNVWFTYAGTEHLKEGLEFAKRAIALDTDDSLAHAAHGMILFLLGHDGEGISGVERSLELNPNDADVLRWMGSILGYVGRAVEGVEYVQNAIRLNPFNTGYDAVLGITLYHCGRFEEAADVLRKKGGIRYRWMVGYLAAAYGQLGRLEEARSVADKFVALRQADLRERAEPVPGSTLELAYEIVEQCRRPEDADLFLDGLRKAGLK